MQPIGRSLFWSAEIKNMPKASDFLTAALVKICMIFVSADVESKGARRLKPRMSMIKNVGTDVASFF